MHSTEHQVFIRLGSMTKLCLSLYYTISYPVLVPTGCQALLDILVYDGEKNKSLHSVYAHQQQKWVSVLEAGRAWKGIACVRTHLCTRCETSLYPYQVKTISAQAISSKSMKEGTNETLLWGRGLWAEGAADAGGRSLKWYAKLWNSRTYFLALYGIRIAKVWEATFKMAL